MDLTEFEEERSQEWLTESLAHGKIQLSLTKPRKVEKKNFEWKIRHLIFDMLSLKRICYPSEDIG